MATILKLFNREGHVPQKSHEKNPQPKSDEIILIIRNNLVKK